MGKKNNQKAIPLKAAASNKKAAFREIPESAQDQTICWSFKIIDYDGKHGWNHIAFGKHREEIFSKLANFESQKWSQIIHQSNKHHHFVSKDQIIREAQKRLEELQLDDIDEVFSLRLDGKKRIWGIREGRTLKLLWWDPNHEICPSPKKHT